MGPAGGFVTGNGGLDSSGLMATPIDEPAMSTNPCKFHFITSLNSEISVLHDFDVGKVSQIHKTYLLDQQLFYWRHFSKTEVEQIIDLNILALYEENIS